MKEIMYQEQEDTICHLQNSLNDSNKRNKKLQEKLDDFDAESDKIAQLILENSQLSEMVGNGKYEGISQLFKSTLEQLKIVMECKVILDPLVDPVILKSGNTVSGKVFKDLKKDPFDNTKDCKERIPNLLAKEVIEILKYTKNKLKSLPKAVKSYKSTQTSPISLPTTVHLPPKSQNSEYEPSVQQTDSDYLSDCTCYTQQPNL